MNGSGDIGEVGGVQMSPPRLLDGSPVSTPSTTGQKRKRHTPGQEVTSDPEEHGEGHDQEKTRHVPKRACNECRQQKLRCDVIPEPYKVCSRCNRLKLECRIDASFKRVGKRSKNAEMEREIADLRRRLAGKNADDNGATGPFNYSVNTIAAASTKSSNMLPELRHDGVANSLLDLRRRPEPDVRTSSVSRLPDGAKVLGSNILHPEQYETLFQEYYRCYHPFLPILDVDRTPDHHFELCPLVFWTVIIVAARRSEDDLLLLTGLRDDYEKLVWSTIASVPQNYHVVKALAILCTWPLPTKSTSSDQTLMLSGLMKQIALQTGLHRPSHVQDFSRNIVELRDVDIQDRLKTWAVCNIVSQGVSTSWGQPSETVYDWTLTTLKQPETHDPHVCDDIYWKLQVERFVDKVSRKFYNNTADPLGISSDQERATWISLLIEDYRDLEGKITLDGTSMDDLYLKAAGLHLRLSAFFDTPTSPNYITDLLELYNATTTFLRAAFDLEYASGPTLRYASRYIVLMILAAGFTLLKLLNSFFARHINIPSTKALFSNSIRGIRSISIANNDLPARLAEVLAQLWHSYGAGMRPTSGPVDSSLQLKVRSRMSMSLVYDSVWRWREEFQFKGDGTTAVLDSAVNNPTQPDVLSDNGGSGNVSSAASVSGGNVLAHPGQSLLDPPGAMMGLQDASVPSAGLNDSFIDHDYNLFDPLAFMLDAPTEFPMMGEDFNMDMHMQLPFS